MKADLEQVRFDLQDLDALPDLGETASADDAPSAARNGQHHDSRIKSLADSLGSARAAGRASVADDIEALVQAISPAAHAPARGTAQSEPSGAERRRRARAKIAFRVHVRGGVGTLQTFEDIATSLDATRDGLLLSSSRVGYATGEILQVTFPYWSTPTALNQSRRAKVVRSSLMHNARYGVAIEFEEATGNDNAGPWIAAPFPNQVRVLGVESNLRLACEMRELLEQDGYNVVVVSTAQQALDILRYETPDVLLAEADPRNAEISGHDLCAIVKKNDRLRHVPVILLTSSALPSDYSASYKLGAIVCMMKPCKPELLQRAVHLVAAPPTARSIYSGKFNIAPFVRTS